MIEKFRLRAVLPVLFALVMVPGIGCRSLVEPGAQVERAPDRFFVGSIVEPNGLPITFMQATLSNSAYANAWPYVRAVEVSENGEFSIPLPPDFEGLFDLDVSYFGSARPSTFLFLGLRDAEEPARLELAMTRVQGRIEVPSELTGFEFGPYALRLQRIESRPDPGRLFGFQRTAFPLIGSSGDVDDIVPGGEWFAWIRCDGCGPFAHFGALVDPDFEGGSISKALSLTRFVLTPRLPSGWTDPITAELSVEQSSSNYTVQEFTLGADPLEAWGPPEAVNVRVEWPPSIGSQFAVAAPSLNSGRVDLRTTQVVELVLPPHVLRIEVRDGDEVLPDAMVRLKRPFATFYLEADAAGKAAFFCEKGSYELHAEHEGRERDLRVLVNGDTEIVVDFDEAVSTRRD